MMGMIATCVSTCIYRMDIPLRYQVRATSNECRLEIDKQNKVRVVNLGPTFRIPKEVYHVTSSQSNCRSQIFGVAGFVAALTSAAQHTDPLIEIEGLNLANPTSSSRLLDNKRSNAKTARPADPYPHQQ